MDDGFQVVKSKGRKPKRDRGKNFSAEQFLVEYIEVDEVLLTETVNKVSDTFKESKFKQSLIAGVKESVNSVDTILCFGLGSFSESPIARHQLAALLSLKNYFDCSTSAYDPIFNPQEIEVLRNFGICVPKENDEAKSSISTLGTTLVYFAHCSSQLVNNFLWANWTSALHNCVILSNSFSTVIRRNNEDTVRSLSCMRDVIAISKEHKVEDDYEVSGVFNDLSIHIFPSAQVSESNFWLPRPEPNYNGQPLEFCTKEAVITLRLL